MHVSRDRLVLAWSIGLALVVLAPLGLRGHVLSYDMVWVPHPDLARSDLWGLGTALPRAVPSDAWASVLGSVLPAVLVQRLVLLGVLVVGAVGAARLVRDLPTGAALVAATVWTWNPFVAERLLIGHWPLLVGYAALPWLLLALRTASWGAVIACSAALGSTPAGGLMAAVVVLAAARGLRARAVGVSIAALTSLPWIVTGALHAAEARSGRAAVEAFALGSDGPMGPWLSALTLGGIWNQDVVPASRSTWVAAALALVLLALVGVGLGRLLRTDRDLAVRLIALAVVGLVVAGAGRLAPGLLTAITEHVPGGGVLRDGTRWLALLAPAWAVGAAHGATVVLERIGDASRVVATGLLVLVPIAVVPDLAWGVAGRLDAVEYPGSWSAMRDDVEASGATGDLLVLPATSYRAPEWNGDRPVLDPVGKYFPRTAVVSDELVVAGEALPGEDRRASDAADAAAAGDVDGLRDLGIGLVLADTSAGPVPAAFDGPGAIRHDTLVLTELGDAESYRATTGERAAVIAAWVVYAATLIFGIVPAIGRRFRAAGGGRPVAAGDADPT